MYNLFISAAAPYKNVTPETVAFQVLETLGKTELNIKAILTHTLYSASTSVAYNKSLSLSKLAKGDGWSNFAIFGKFYNKPIHLFLV